MNRLQEYLEELGSCGDEAEWIAKYDDPRKAWGECDRGDWMVWLVTKQGVDPRKIAYVNYLMVKPVEYLMKDVRSKDALDALRRYGLGEIDEVELSKYAAAAYAPYVVAPYAAPYAAAPYAAAPHAAYAVYAACAACAADASVYAAADASVYAAADASVYAAADAAESDPNNPHTYESYLATCADICRENLTELIDFEI